MRYFQVIKSDVSVNLSSLPLTPIFVKLVERLRAPGSFGSVSGEHRSLQHRSAFLRFPYVTQWQQDSV